MIQQYTQYMSSVRGYSQHTVNAYVRDINHFARWAMATVQGVRWSTMTRSTIDAYMSALSDHGYTPATINRRLASISSLFHWMQREGLKVDNPCRYESRKKIARRQPSTIDADSIRQAISQAREDVAVAIQLIWTAGLRTSEVLNLHTWDIDRNELSIIVRGGKGAKDRKVYTDADTMARLQRYAAGKRGLIFYWSARELRYEVWQALKCTSSAPSLNPRALRHTFATTMAKNGANATTIAALMGHEQLATTQRYIDFAGVGVREQYLKFNPNQA